MSKRVGALHIDLTPSSIGIRKSGQIAPWDEPEEVFVNGHRYTPNRETNVGCGLLEVDVLDALDELEVRKRPFRVGQQVRSTLHGPEIPRFLGDAVGVVTRVKRNALDDGVSVRFNNGWTHHFFFGGDDTVVTPSTSYLIPLD